MKLPKWLTPARVFSLLSAVIVLDLVLRFTSGRATRSAWEMAVTVWLFVGLAFTSMLLMRIVLRRSKRQQ